MAKKDDVHARNEMDVQKSIGQNNIDQMRSGYVVPQAQEAWNNFKNASGQQMGDYNRIMGDYQGWAKNGGFSDQDMGNMRARSLAPIRSLYANANRDVNRQAGLQGGYSPGMGALKARMARDLSSQTSDAAQNTEGMLAQLRNQGKQFGMQGQSGMYGATPGLTSTYGNLQNNTMQNWLGTEGLQRDMFSNLNQGYAGSRGKGFDYSWIGPAIGAAGAMSDRNLKENITEISDEKILEKLSELPVTTWNYIGDDKQHIGPMAQDFQEMFGIGDGKTINLMDAIGILIAANKALLKKLENSHDAK